MVFKKVIEFDDIEDCLDGRIITLAYYQHRNYRGKNFFSKKMSYDTLSHYFEVKYVMSERLKKDTSEKSKYGLFVGEPKKFESHNDAIDYYNNIKKN